MRLFNSLEIKKSLDPSAKIELFKNLTNIAKVLVLEKVECFFRAVQTSDQKEKVTFFDVKKNQPYQNLFFMIGLEKSFFFDFFSVSK